MLPPAPAVGLERLPCGAHSAMRVDGFRAGLLVLRPPTCGDSGELPR